uniref:Uncharacterized protein n=1 Tax=Magallana gigas TaxID=29159 RepID=A0A8W8IC89_MAGGI
MAIVLPRYFDVLELGLENDRDSTFCLTKLSTERTEGGKKSQLKEKFGHVLFKQESLSITSLYDVTTRNDTALKELREERSHNSRRNSDTFFSNKSLSALPLYMTSRQGMTPVSELRIPRIARTSGGG